MFCDVLYNIGYFVRFVMQLMYCRITYVIAPIIVNALCSVYLCPFLFLYSGQI
jgi:hypothetical protein